MTATTTQTIEMPAVPVSPVISGTNAVYLMGFSFILGCLFTVLMLMLLDFMRRNVEKRKPRQE